MEKELERQSYTLKNDEKSGSVAIADDVVAMIASIAATEVDGVGAMVGNITNELMSKVGMKKLTKGVKVSVTPEKVDVELAITIDYGFSIPQTCTDVQVKVKNAIENMTGLTVDTVNVRIAGINIKD